MAEKNTDTENQTKQEPMAKRPEISHFGGKPIHPKVEKASTEKPTNKKDSSGRSNPQTNKAKTTGTKRKSAQAAKLHDPDFAGKKAIKKPTAKTEQVAESKQATKPAHIEASKVTAEEKDEDKQDAKGLAAEKLEINSVEDSNAIEKLKTQEEPSRPEGGEFLGKPQSKSRRHTLPAVVRVGFALALIVGTSLLFTWYTFLRQFEWDFGTVSNYMTDFAGQYYLTFGIILCAMGVLAAVTWKVFFTVGATFSLLSILTFVNSQKLALRDAPFLPDDLRMAGNLGQVASFGDQDAIMRLIAGVVLVLVATILLEIFAKKVFGRDSKKLPWWERHVVIPRVTYTLVAFSGLVSLTMPLLRQKPASWVQGMELTQWNQTINYEANGVIIGFVNNLGRMELEKPENYSEETMREIAERYGAKKEADKTARKPLTDVVDRIIVILDETFYDPALLTKYYPHEGGDVLPNIHKIFRDYPSGYMYSPEYGGNTANVEFEVQTGLSNYWASTIPYVTAITKTSGLTSVASIAQNLGYETTAIHSYDGSMYKRNLVYPLLGYDTFIDRSEMKNRDKEPGPEETMNLNDRAIFKETLDVLAEGSEYQMVNVVTMQNHSPYWLAEYPKWEFPVEYNEDDTEYHSRNNNYQSLHEADKYIAEFLGELEKSDERTVVLWFGDHAAGVFEKYVNSEDKNDRDTIHLTPYFIWTNFETKDLYTAAEVREHNTKLGITIPSSIRGVDLPTTTPNCLQNTMYNLLGVEKPAFFYLVDEVCATTPILAHSYLEDTDLAETQALEDYELVNYDALSGKRYWKYE